MTVTQCFGGWTTGDVALISRRGKYWKGLFPNEARRNWRNSRLPMGFGLMFESPKCYLYFEKLPKIILICLSIWILVLQFSNRAQNASFLVSSHLLYLLESFRKNHNVIYIYKNRFTFKTISMHRVGALHLETVSSFTVRLPATISSRSALHSSYGTTISFFYVGFLTLSPFLNCFSQLNSAEKQSGVVSLALLARASFLVALVAVHSKFGKFSCGYEGHYDREVFFIEVYVAAGMRGFADWRW